MSSTRRNWLQRKAYCLRMARFTRESGICTSKDMAEESAFLLMVYTTKVTGHKGCLIRWEDLSIRTKLYMRDRSLTSSQTAKEF